MKTKLLFILIFALLAGVCNIACMVVTIGWYESIPEPNVMYKDYDGTLKPANSTSISLLKNSMLSYNKRQGDVWGDIRIKYQIVDNILATDSIIVYEWNYGVDSPEIINARFFFSPDSLVNMNTQEVFFYRDTTVCIKRSKIVRYVEPRR